MFNVAEAADKAAKIRVEICSECIVLVNNLLFVSVRTNGRRQRMFI